MRTVVVIAAGSLPLPCAAQGTVYAGFEQPNYNASTAGTTLTGQQGWLPFYGGNQAAFSVFTYAGNAPGFAQNPVGGNQFVAAVAGPQLTSSFLPVPFTLDPWTMSCDTCVRFQGATPAQPNLGAFRLDHVALNQGFQYFINLFNFNNPSTPQAGWRSHFNVYNASGAPLNNQSPGAFWDSLH